MTQDLGQLGKYRILAEIGKGGFATVYRALDTTLDREVALKVLDPLLMRDATWVSRFHREARAVARLKHPHIVTIYEIGEVEGRLFIAMELVEGPSLAGRIAESGRLSWDETLAILEQVADALDYAHGQGVLHRDLKPGNILLDPQRGAILTDFGFARLVGESSMSVSVSGGVVGTPAYIAPEVWDGEEPTRQTDLYALGCIVYEMLTGEVLFSGKTPSVVMRKHLMEGPQLPDAAQWPKGVPAGVADVVPRALLRHPRERFASAGRFVVDLSAATAHDIARQKAVERAQQEAETAAHQQREEIVRQEAARRAAEEQARREATERAQRETGKTEPQTAKPRWPVWVGLGGVAMVALALALSGVRGSHPAPTPQVIDRIIKETVIVEKPVERIIEKTVVSEKPVEKTVIVEKPVEKIVRETVIVEKEKVVQVTVAAPTATFVPTREPTRSTVSPVRQATSILYTCGTTWQRHDICVMGLDGANSRTLLSLGNAEHGAPRYSPDGSKMVFYAGSEGTWNLYIANSDGSGARKLTEVGGGSNPAWSPDGKRILYDSVSHRLYTISADGTSQAEIQNQGGGVNGFPDWSPDGSKIAFSSNREGHWEVYVLTVGSSGSPARLTNSPANSWCPAWSPDGSKLVFVRWASAYQDAIFIMNADGSDARQLTDTSNNEVPVWSPDGKQIMFTTRRGGGGRQIYVMNADGSNQHRITNGQGDLFWPTWIFR